MTVERGIIESLFMIANKDSEDVPFLLNPHQAKIDTELALKNIVPKPRQEGISAYALALFTVRCLSKRNTRAVVISHDREATQKLLERVHYYLEHLKGPKPVLGTSSKNEISFPKTNSSFFLGTAGTREFGRGDTITDLHCSEVAFWESPKRLVAGLFQALTPNGTAILESTGNGVGNWYHKRVMRALEGGSQYKLHFPDWRLSPEYSIACTPEQEEDILNNLDTSLEEPKVREEFGLTAGQLLWRRNKLEEMDYDIPLFKQEYPLTVHECFQSAGFSLFHRVVYQPTPLWVQDKLIPELYYHTDHYNPNFNYVMGVDIGAGVEKDKSVIQVICCENDEQVAEFAADKIPPDVFARTIGDIGSRYNFPIVVVESNNHGAVTLDNLRKHYPIAKIYRDRQSSNNVTRHGYRTTSKTKPIVIGNLRKSLAEGMVIHSEMLKGELDTFVEKESGRLEAVQGCFDDRVMALAMANVAALKQWKYINSEAKPTLELKPGFLEFDSIIKEFGTNSGESWWN